jgi:hypothetical protein
VGRDRVADPQRRRRHRRALRVLRTRAIPARPLAVAAAVAALVAIAAAVALWTTAPATGAVKRPAVRTRVLLTGDSLVYGLYDVLARQLRPRGVGVIGDPNPSTGISKSSALDWPAHARTSTQRLRPQATIVFLGFGEGFDLTPPGAAPEPCCGPPWIAEYARRVAGMISTYRRGGRAWVYWVILPAPKDPRMAAIAGAVNSAIRLGASGFHSHVRVIEAIARTIAPGDRFRQSIVFRGRRTSVRAPDGFHLSAPGIHIAAPILERQLRRDGLVR